MECNDVARLEGPSMCEHTGPRPAMGNDIFAPVVIDER
jgi:hypothetical protein